MIRIELYERADGVMLYKTYSDKNVLIQKVGTDEKYEEAIDIEGAGYTYLETDEEIIKELADEEI